MSPTTPGMICSAAMERVHQVLDGDLMDATDRTSMESHLAVCSECAEAAAQLREMQDTLRGFAETPLPGPALDNVWERSVRAPAAVTRRRFDWRFAAAAAAVVFVAWIGLRGWPVEQRQDEQALRAASEVRVVLQLTANAIKRSEQVAIKQVFTDEISPALRKVGVRWPEAADDTGKGAEL